LRAEDENVHREAVERSKAIWVMYGGKGFILKVQVMCLIWLHSECTYLNLFEFVEMCLR